MVTLPNPDYLKEIAESPKSNGQDPGLDPKIANLIEFIDRALRTRNDVTVGMFVAAVGILLGRRSLNPDNLERIIYDVTTAVRVGFYLDVINKQGK
jgi:hypothetical protein